MNKSNNSHRSVLVKLGLVFLVLTGFMIYGIFYFKDKYFSRSVETRTTPVEITSELIAKTLTDSAEGFKTYENGPWLAKFKDKATIPLQGGKALIMHFWASWCEPCINEIPDLLHYVERAKDVQIVLVSQDYNYQDLNKFLKSFPGLKSTQTIQIWDADSRIVSALGIEKLPSTIFITPAGKVTKKDGVVNWTQF